MANGLSVITNAEILDKRTGVYRHRATMELLALAFDGEKVRLLGSCSMSLSREEQYAWLHKIGFPGLLANEE